MNRMPSKEEMQKYLQRWHQLKAQYGDQVVNIPEYAQLTKVMKAFQAQFKQAQANAQQFQQQQFQQQQQQQHHQQHPQQQLPQVGTPQFAMNASQGSPSFPPQQTPYANFPNNVAPGLATQTVAPQAGPVSGLMPGLMPGSVPTSLPGSAPSQQATLSSAPGQNFPYVPPTESPFSTKQIQLLKAQNQAVKYLFKNNGSYPQIPNNIIELAVNERMAFPEPQFVPGSQPPPPQPEIQPSPHVIQSPSQVQIPPSTKSTPPVPTPQDKRPSSGPAQNRPAKGKGTPEAPKIPVATMKEAPPVNIKELVPDKEKSDMIIVPVTKPTLQVDAYEFPDLVSDTINSIPYNAMYIPQSRVQYPSIAPEGFDFDNILNNREVLILLEREYEIDELKLKLASIPEELEERQLIEAELNKLELLSYQKELRGRVLSQMWFSKLILPNSHPNFLAKFNSLLLDSITATQSLYQQQMFSIVQAQKRKHQSTVTKIISHRTLRLDRFNSRREKLEKYSNKVISFHSQVAREEQKKVERMAKQRLQALKSNDEEAYLKLLDHTKDTRITHLLKQTDQFLDSLAQAVQTQQKDHHDKLALAGRVKTENEFANDEERREKIDYYEVAHRVKEEVTKQPSILVGGTLKEYQIKGLQWMVSLYNNHLNGILADEMGLGKTIQTISLITYLIEVKQVYGPFLVIVPLSTLTNWNLEFEKWAPTVRKITYKGTPNQRKVMQGDIRAGNFQILLTTFEYIIKDRNLLSKVKWVHMIIDEGHRMKNAQSKLSETLTHHYHSDYRLILTGTPLQNNLPELWALLNFALPKIFNSVKSFDEWFNTPFANTGGQDKIELSEEETLLVIRRLHKVLRPFLLRRLKKDVEKDLPNKVEKVIKCKMSALQSKLYQMMLKYNVLFAGTADAPVTIKNANNQLMQLRKICNHPFVYEEVENLINPSVETNDHIWRVAGKFELLDKVLPKFKATGHRVLIFFQMTQIMDIMEDFLRLRGLKYMRLDGGTKSDDRTGLLKLFNAPNSDYFCFLLSTRAGGLGLNLQTADTVIIFDTDWNPHQDLQAQDRAHRIGQKNEVRILRLITEDSIEEMILERAHAKLEIDGKVIQAGKFDNKSTAEEQEALLRALLEKDEERRNKGIEDEDELDDDELNQIVARTDNELVVFRRLDEERAAATRAASYPTRLFSESELPEVYKIDPGTFLQSDKLATEYGRGARERKAASYDDNLTEEQWLKKIDGVISESDEEDAKPKRGRGRKKKEVLDDDDDDFGNKKRGADEGSKRPLKRTKKKGLGSRITPAIDPLTEIERLRLQTLMDQLLEIIINYTNEHGRRLSDLFMVKPSRKLYPDYYVLIKNPIALDVIKRQVATRTYTHVREFLEDVHLMFSNARIYNEEGSIVYQDAMLLENLTIENFHQLDMTTSPDEKVKILDFAEFDELHGLKPLVVSNAIKKPIEDSIRLDEGLLTDTLLTEDSTPFFD